VFLSRSCFCASIVWTEKTSREKRKIPCIRFLTSVVLEWYSSGFCYFWEEGYIYSEDSPPFTLVHLGYDLLADGPWFFSKWHGSFVNIFCCDRQIPSYTFDLHDLLFPVYIVVSLMIMHAWSNFQSIKCYLLWCSLDWIIVLSVLCQQKLKELLGGHGIIVWGCAYLIHPQIRPSSSFIKTGWVFGSIFWGMNCAYEMLLARGRW